jgi:hypothetical protein
MEVKIYKAVILPVIMYGCEAWSLTLREEHRLRVFENRVVRRMFGPKRDEVTGEWKMLNSEELYVMQNYFLLSTYTTYYEEQFVTLLLHFDWFQNHYSIIRKVINIKMYLDKMSGHIKLKLILRY